jgi:predicted alpha/beta hydrolase family esterase
MSSKASNLCVLTLPGWQNSGSQHWQSLWESEHGDVRVMQHDWMTPKRGDWVARLEDVVLESDAPIVFAAHSLGCHLVAAWCAISKNTARVKGTLLVAPPDLHQADLPNELHAWKPALLTPLKIRATMVASSNDPFSQLTRTRELAQAWRVPLVEIGDKGHINGDSNLGTWPEGRALLNSLS